MAGVAGVPGVGRMINDRAPATAPYPTMHRARFPCTTMHRR